jgi:predicted O-linked N-acetylglucosamine transferase (SPINDLY family)
MARHRLPPDPRRRGQETRSQDAGAIAARLQQAVACHRAGDFAQAARLYRELLAAQPDLFDALHLLGVLEGQRGNAAAAAELIGRALRVNPNHAEAHSNLGNALRELKRHEEALGSYERALALRPDAPEALVNRGNALHELKRHEEALVSYERALALRPDHPAALFNRGNVLRDLNRPVEALGSYERALALDPRHLKALVNRGNLLLDLRRHEEALGSYDAALRVRPDQAEVHYNRGNALALLARYPEALASYGRAIALRPGYAEAFNNRGNLLLRLKRPDEAARDFARVIELDPEFEFARGALLHAKMLACDWDGLADLAHAIERDVLAGRRSTEPFGFHAVSRSEAVLRRCAEIYAQARFPPAPIRLWNGERYRHRRIRLGYVSGELFQHSITVLMAELFERHDRGRFELFAFDNGPDDASETRRRVRAAFDEVIDITRMTDLEAAQAARRREIDILVNLNGYFGRLRQGVFAHRPSPVQVTYLGFPSTSGAPYMDYILADRHVIPPADRVHYSEQVVYLPDCYQPNDTRRRAAPRAPTRAEAGLPEAGFVFCCFNNVFKITPEVFDTWVRLLERVPGSVLWLLEESAAASSNLRREARARGGNPDRLVFATMVPLDEHLARLRLADLFLDTLPYNAHTTGSLALWAGLPVLTCEGTTFAGRVGASLLRAMGAPGLVASSLPEYEARALELAARPAELAAIRATLERNRATHPLFDAERFRRHIEAAYLAMWERAERGEPPESFAVEP